MLYNFVRQILTGERAPFDAYGGADVTIPGILAVRSAMEGGKPYDVPDFRKKSERDKWRNDDWAQEPYPEDASFPKNADFELTKHFSTTMTNLVRHALQYRAYVDWSRVVDDMVEPHQVAAMLEGIVANHPDMCKTYAMARRLVDAYPKSNGARVLREMLEDIGGEDEVMADGFLGKLKRRLKALRKKHPAPKT